MKIYKSQLAARLKNLCPQCPLVPVHMQFSKVNLDSRMGMPEDLASRETLSLPTGDRHVITIRSEACSKGK